MPALLGILLWAASAVALLLLAGIVYQALGTSRDSRRHPPPGRMVDVGGHRLHLVEMGEGSPTVVLDAALGASSLSWTLVQSEIAKLTRVCAYDRAGLGWSEAGPMPCTAQRITEELHALLANAGIEPPYVLVGHSFGALVARLFASNYPGEVAGLVLLDPPHPKQWLELTPEEEHRIKTGARLSRRGAWVARVGLARLIAFFVAVGALDAARSGVATITGGALRYREGDRILAPMERLPAEVRPALQTFWTQPKFYEAVASQIECMPESAAQVARTRGYGDLPLAVIAASHPSPARLAEQEEIARLSSNGKCIIASRSGHWLPLDEPKLVIQVVREVVEAARRTV